jgi:transcriptional regulator with XRE-family HTH domain
MSEGDDLALRARELGALLRQAREAAGKTPAECAALLDLAPDEYEEFEAGGLAVSLPELELLAYSLDVPLTRFWNGQNQAPAEAGPAEPADAGNEFLLLRHRLVGAQVRAARAAAGLSPAELAQAAGVPAEDLPAYELGEAPIPLPELERLAQALRLPMAHFLAEQGPIADWDAKRRAYERFNSLPPDLREFVSDPMNEGYLRLAMQLSALSVERLRGIAEGILDITY